MPSPRSAGKPVKVVIHSDLADSAERLGRIVERELAGMRLDRLWREAQSWEPVDWSREGLTG